jgi:capsid protein
VRAEKAGRPIEFCNCQRGKTTDAGSNAAFSFERIVPARNFYHFGYFDRFDQVRGIAPLATAVNTLRDTYEGMDYALAKMKVS